ncbi:EamA family transporter RarD [Xinfangfangia sp. D13-10-4-6]|uniref:EamA family transporter RarD n=1 Tax=Pseudogemmobacter hezensis TaxID=2737662 RepID=UPI0015560846|nr:EamA family transporter RarD [Pseudogemmobacter hezensis]NPD15600.1 EamA family transporter RarD [Pseudogemmobacter hezensis]
MEPRQTPQPVLQPVSQPLSQPGQSPDSGDSLSGFLYALGAYVLWGFLPLYMKQLDQVSPVEVVAHRVIWALPVAFLVLALTGRISGLKAALRNPAMLGMAMVTAGLLSLNWGLYVWAIASGRALDAALGYYINPLFSVLLGRILLGERLSSVQWLAIASAAIGVVILTVEAGRLPFLALGMTLTWGIYAYFKKSLPIGPNQGFALEVLVLLIPALVVITWFGISGRMVFLHGPGWQSLMLVLLGLVTAGPLILYANGAKRLRLTTIAMMQYIAPTMIFLIAVFVFNEAFSMIKLVAFGFIWLALVIYTASMLRRGRKALA